MKLRVYVNDFYAEHASSLLTTVKFNLNRKYKILMTTYDTSHAVPSG